MLSLSLSNSLFSTPNITVLQNLAIESDFFDDGTFITANFNPDDATLQQLLLGFTYDEVAKVSMYNFSGSSSTLTKDMTWALTQGK